MILEIGSNLAMLIGMFGGGYFFLKLVEYFAK